MIRMAETGDYLWCHAEFATASGGVGGVRAAGLGSLPLAQVVLVMD